MANQQIDNIEDINEAINPITPPIDGQEGLEMLGHNRNQSVILSRFSRSFFKIYSHFITLYSSVKTLTNGKEDKIVKNSGFNKEKTDLVENDTNKVFSAKGAFDLKNWLVTNYTTLMNNIRDNLTNSINTKLPHGGYGGSGQQLKNDIDTKVSKSGDTMTGSLILTSENQVVVAQKENGRTLLTQGSTNGIGVYLGGIRTEWFSESGYYGFWRGDSFNLQKWGIDFNGNTLFSINANGNISTKGNIYLKDNAVLTTDGNILMQVGAPYNNRYLSDILLDIEPAKYNQKFSSHYFHALYNGTVYEHCHTSGDKDIATNKVIRCLTGIGTNTRQFILRGDDGTFTVDGNVFYRAGTHDNPNIKVNKSGDNIAGTFDFKDTPISIKMTNPENGVTYLKRGSSGLNGRLNSYRTEWYGNNADIGFHRGGSSDINKFTISFNKGDVDTGYQFEFMNSGVGVMNDITLRNTNNWYIETATSFDLKQYGQGRFHVSIEISGRDTNYGNRAVTSSFVWFTGDARVFERQVLEGTDFMSPFIITINNGVISVRAGLGSCKMNRICITRIG